MTTDYCDVTSPYVYCNLAPDDERRRCTYYSASARWNLIANKNDDDNDDGYDLSSTCHVGAVAVTRTHATTAACFCEHWLVSLRPGMGAKYCDQRSCMSVCPLAYLKSHTSKLHEIFCTCCLWPWLGLSPMTVQKNYVMYFQFSG